METNKKQLLERIKTANNILVTVSANPSVDQLSAAIGLTLMLNKLDKHATAVFSGQVPSTMEFLQPEKTLEKNTDSLRDFIIALDKSKADKLRYKVEDNSVKIFITPYRTSISQSDLDFSQGDFNVEVVVALGVNEQKDLDQAIVSHGRILHDATTVSVTTGAPSTLGSINWADERASSLCEMIASLADQLQPNLLDAQMATALMTGIVAQTDRFSNDKTFSSTMTISAALMSAGANQQLVASKLEEAVLVPLAADVSSEPAPAAVLATSEDGSLTIEHISEDQPVKTPEEPVEEIHIDEEGTVKNLPEEYAPSEVSEQKPLPEIKNVKGGGSFLPDSIPNAELSVGNITTGANEITTGANDTSDGINAPQMDIPLLSHDGDTHSDDSVEVSNPPQPQAEEPMPAELVSPHESTMPPYEPTPVELPAPSSLPTFEAPAPEPAVPEANDLPVDELQPEDKPQTLSELEAAVQASYDSHTSDAPDFSQPLDLPAPLVVPEQTPSPIAGVDSARDAVSDALASINQPLPPIAALNAMPLEPPISDQVSSTDTFSMPENLVPPTGMPADITAAPANDPSAPPTVPPPFMPDMNGFDSNQVPPLGGNDRPPQPPSNPGNPFNLPPN